MSRIRVRPGTSRGCASALFSENLTEYRETSKRLKRFRSEAIRTGFRRAWQDQDYGTIVSVGRRIPDSVLQNDPKLLMWYDQAVTRGGGEP